MKKVLKILFLIFIRPLPKWYLKSKKCIGQKLWEPCELIYQISFSCQVLMEGLLSGVWEGHYVSLCLLLALFWSPCRSRPCSAHSLGTATAWPAAELRCVPFPIHTPEPLHQRDGVHDRGDGVRAQWWLRAGGRRGGGGGGHGQLGNARAGIVRSGTALPYGLLWSLIPHVGPPGSALPRTAGAQR